jgi:hypothetical protein
MADDNIVVRISAQVGELVAGLAEAKEAVAGFGEAIGSLIGGLGGGLEAVITALGLKEIKELAESMAELGEQALNTAFILGTTVEESDQVTTAMRLLGVNAETASRTLQFLGRSIHQALIDESSRAAVGFKNLGIPMEEVRRNANDLTGMLQLLLEHISKLAPAGLEGAGALRDVLGRGLQTLAPLLRANTEEFQEALEAAKEHTAAMAENAVGMDKTAQAMHKLGTDTETFGIRSFQLFKPAIDAVISGLDHLIEALTAVVHWLSDLDMWLNKNISSMQVFVNRMLGLESTADQLRAAEGWEERGTFQFQGTGAIGHEKAGGRGSKGSDDRMSIWRDELRQRLQEEQNFLGDSKREELDYWQAKLALVGTGTQEDLKLRREVNAEIFSLQKQLAKETEQIQIEEQTYAQKVNDETLSAKRKHLQARQELGEISKQQLIQQEKSLLDQQMAADEEYYHKKEAAAQGDLKTITKLEQEEFLEHQKLMDERGALDDEALKEAHASWMSIGDAITGAVDRSVTGVIQGTQTIGQAFAKLGQSILEMFVNLGIQKAVASVMDSLWSGLGIGGMVSANVAAGGSGGLFASIFGGLFGAGASSGAGLSTAEVMALALQGGGIIPSARGGWHVPSFADGGTLAKVHSGEMVLPKHISDWVQDAAGRGGGGAGGPTFHINAIDPSHGANFLMSHAGDINRAWRQGGLYGNLSPRAISSGGRYP